jgi:hypothetical protein
MTGATTGSGGNNGSSPLPISPNPFTFNEGVTIITWTACNISGCSTPCTQEVIVEDKEPPTFTAIDHEFCVSPIIQATYNGQPEPGAGIVEPRPDWYIVNSNDLDLIEADFKDNCCTSGFIVRWQITNVDGTALSAPLDQVFDGQPSEFIAAGNEIKLIGSADSDVIYMLHYWLEDCNSNTSDDKEVKITITPRPKIIKMN